MLFLAPATRVIRRTSSFGVVSRLLCFKVQVLPFQNGHTRFYCSLILHYISTRYPVCILLLSSSSPLIPSHIPSRSHLSAEAENPFAPELLSSVPTLHLGGNGILISIYLALDAHPNIFIPCAVANPCRA